MTIGLAAEYAHPLEYILGNGLPANIGILILGNKIHLFTCMCWITWRHLETLDGHCGYEFPWSPYRLLPGATSAEYHDFHHSKNVGNYSATLSIWDNVFGTNKVYYEHLNKKYDNQKEKAQ